MIMAPPVPSQSIGLCPGHCVHTCALSATWICGSICTRYRFMTL